MTIQHWTWPEENLSVGNKIVLAAVTSILAVPACLWAASRPRGLCDSASAAADESEWINTKQSLEGFVFIQNTVDESLFRPLQPVCDHLLIATRLPASPLIIHRERLQLGELESRSASRWNGNSVGLARRCHGYPLTRESCSDAKMITKPGGLRLQSAWWKVKLGRMEFGTDMGNSDSQTQDAVIASFVSLD